MNPLFFILKEKEKSGTHHAAYKNDRIDRTEVRHMQFRKFLDITLGSAAACCLVLAGCGSTSENVSTNTEALKRAEYPIQTKETLHYWIPELQAVGNFSTRAVFPVTEELERQTGIDVEWILPTRGQEKQQFNILMASGDLPDIIEWRWPDYPGGAEKALADGVITPLNELRDYTPNLNQVLSQNTLFDKLSKTDSGKYYMFPVFRDTGQPEGYKLVVSSGYMMRKDWLDELGLPVPETMEEWHFVLTAFKEKKGAEFPLSLTLEDMKSGLGNAYGIYLDFYQENGVVKYGRIEPGYRDFLREMKRWLDEGLLDPSFATIDYESVGGKICNDRAGAAFGWLGGQMGTWTTQARKNNAKFELVGVPFPTMQKGGPIRFTPKEAPVISQGSAAISAKSQRKELAAKFLDYMYGDAGHMLANFGVEGDTYRIENGKPIYTDKILKNADGLSVGQALTLYTRATAPGPYVQDSQYIEQYYQLPEQLAAQRIWKNTEADQYQLPTLMPTVAEAAAYTEKLNNITAYAQEMFLKFIYGDEPLENFDTYVSVIREMGLDSILKSQQDALARYDAR